MLCVRQIVMELKKIWGVGKTTALKLYRGGFRSIEQLRQHEAEAEAAAKVGAEEAKAHRKAEAAMAHGATGQPHPAAGVRQRGAASAPSVGSGSGGQSGSGSGGQSAGGGVSSVLTAQQRIGLRYFEDLQEKILRSEVTLIEKTVCDAARAIVPGALAVCCGSYRRGKARCVTACDVIIVITVAPTLALALCRLLCVYV